MTQAAAVLAQFRIPDEQLRIQQMGIDELRGYMCAKSRGNPNTCQNCLGLDRCSAGKRALELISLSEAKAVPINTIKDRDAFREACETGCPWGYLEATRGISKGAAKELLIAMINRYPDMGAHYGGKKLLLRYRPWNAPEEPQDTPEAASDVEVEQIPTPEPDTPEKAEKTQITQMRKLGPAAKQAAAREACEKALQSGDFIQARLDAGRSRGQAYADLYNWRNRYPDLFEKYGMAKRHDEKEAPMQQETTEDEAVSLSDFLTEFETPEEQHVFPAQEQDITASLPAELQTLYNGLGKEKEQLLETIKQAEDRLKWVEDQQDALEKVASLMRSAASTATAR